MSNAINVMETLMEVYEDNHDAGYPVHFAGTALECLEWILRNEWKFSGALWTREFEMPF